MLTAQGAQEGMRMARKARSNSPRTGGGEANVAAPPEAKQSAGGAAAAGLVVLAEELGRLLARRELARPDRRRGYSLPEALIGATVAAFVWILIAKSLGLLSP